MVEDNCSLSCQFFRWRFLGLGNCREQSASSEARVLWDQRREGVGALRQGQRDLAMVNSVRLLCLDLDKQYSG